MHMQTFIAIFGSIRILTCVVACGYEHFIVLAFYSSFKGRQLIQIKIYHIVLMTSPTNGTLLVLQMQVPLHCVEVVMCKGGWTEAYFLLSPFFHPQPLQLQGM